MSPERTYPILSFLLSPFEPRRRKSLGLAICALTLTSQARSMAVAAMLMGWLRVQFRSALTRFYRLLRNEHIEDLDLTVQLARCLDTAKEPMLLAVDWTEWHHDLRMLVAARVVGKRALPLHVHVCEKQVRLRSQNSKENAFARLLSRALREAGRTALLLCDRGFRRVSWLQLLDQLGLRFVVRLQSDVHVELDSGTRLALSDILLTPGQVLDLGIVGLRSDGAMQVRVVGYLGPGQTDPWWLATTEQVDASRVLSLYDRRMTIEEQFRDLKGCRFGVRLYWTQFRSPTCLARLMLLLGVALLIWLLVGRLASLRDPSLRLPHRTKGPRQSFVTIGQCAVGSPVYHGLLTWSVALPWLELPDLRQIDPLPLGGK